MRCVEKVAVVTGAGGGIGKAQVLALAREGADVLLLDRRVDAMAATVAQVEALGRRALAREIDVRDRASVNAAVDAGVAAFGRIDVLVASAGVFMTPTHTHMLDEDDWDRVLDINLKGCWLTTSAVTPHLIANPAGGSIVLVSSSAGLKGGARFAPYAASKHGMLGLARSLAIELGEHSIRVNTIHPGSVRTPMLMNETSLRAVRPDLEHPTAAEVSDSFRARNLLPVPWVEPEDVAHATVFLASDESRYVTGTELKVDAGYTTR
jgi:SDR family mycofactocin-dependent oxidoreductase